MTVEELELLPWAWATPVEKPSIWALTLALLPAQTPGTRKVPRASLVVTVPGPAPSRRETLAPSSGRPDGVTTEPRRMWSGHPGRREKHRETAGADRPLQPLLGRALCSVSHSTNTPGNPSAPVLCPWQAAWLA